MYGVIAERTKRHVSWVDDCWYEVKSHPVHPFHTIEEAEEACRKMNNHYNYVNDIVDEQDNVVKTMNALLKKPVRKIRANNRFSESFLSQFL